jgi:flagellar hook protein FlgE
MADRSLLAAVSGISANQTYLDNIANNIANVDTVGFKSQSTDFTDLLTEQISGATAPAGVTVGGGVNPLAVGSGVRVGAISTNLTQGSLEQTNQPTDLAIEGSGYLMALQQGQQYFTRAGHLLLDANGNLVTPTGGLIQGWEANGSGVIDTNAPTTAVSIPAGQVIAATATTDITMGGNLPAWSGSGTATPQTTTINAYDSLGDTVPVTFTFTPVSGTAGAWTINGSVPGATSKLWTTPPTLQFDTSTGQLQSINGTSVSTTGPTDLPVTNMPSNYTFPTGDTWNIVFPEPGTSGAVTQFAGQDTAAAVNQDGSAGGSLQSFSIGGNGVITGSFSNGQTLSLGQIALADFANPGGLADVGNTLFQATANSGQPLVGTPNSGGRGSLVGGSLEMSNVNLARQLTDLIVAQEAYQANTKTITTDATVLQSLVNLP